jgi:methionyl-tRNA synthetase
MRAIAILIEPVLPTTSLRIWRLLGLSGTPLAAGWKSAETGSLEAGKPINKPEILFAKLEESVIEKMLSSLPSDDSEQQPAQSSSKASSPKAQSTKSGEPPAAELLDIDQFKKTQIRVARVIEAERVPKSDRLLRLQVSLGGEERRQIIAGIAAHYEPEKIVGKKIVIVANLKPATIMGQRSEGMLLAAADGDGKLSILTVDGDAPEGSPVR